MEAADGKPLSLPVSKAAGKTGCINGKLDYFAPGLSVHLKLFISMTSSFKFQAALVILLVFSLTSCQSSGPLVVQALAPVAEDSLQLDNSKDTLVFGPKGTGLFFEKGSFELPDGTAPTGNISIRIRECYTLSDMVRENLSTTSGGRLLESGGMVQVTAFAGSRELRLKQGKKFIIHFPRDTAAPKKPMALFYANGDKGGVKDWKADSASLVTMRAGLYDVTYFSSDTLMVGLTKYLRFKSPESKDLADYFHENFDASRLKNDTADPMERLYVVKFLLQADGKLTNLTIANIRYGGSNMIDSTTGQKKSWAYDEPYLREFFGQLPEFDLSATGVNSRKLIDSRQAFYIGIAREVPDYMDNETYNRLFREQFNRFRNKPITGVDQAELNYYIFSCSKLGWINCDYFWDVPDAKIDYYVEAGSQAEQDVKLVFKKAKSIMQGAREGDRFVFNNVPVNQDVRIVAITSEGNRSLMATADTKTGTQPFSRLHYEPFSISELEKRLNVN